MNKNNFQNNPNNLSTQIKRAIGSRILLCFILAMITILIITVNDVIISFHQLEKKLEEQCNGLENFVISQVLVKNEDSIQPKLDDLNQKTSTIKFVWDTTKTTTNQKKIKWKFPFSWTYQYPVKHIDGTKLGTFIITGSFFYDHGLLSDLLTKVGLLLSFFTFIFIVLYPLGKRIPQQLFITPVNNLLLLLRNGKTKKENNYLSIIPDEIKEIRDKITTLLDDAEKRSKEAALGQIATQVAHDIRSPLLVLNIETKDLFSIPEKKRIAIRDAIQRVNDIANNLLSQYRQEKNNGHHSLIFSSEPVAAMLQSILSEKRVQISNTSIKIELETCNNANELFINVDIAGFKRALSNLINNSIDAVDDDGTITIRLTKNTEKIVVSITDNGCGIPVNQLPFALEAGVSFGKAQGSGLGLPYVIDKIYSWNSNYTIKTEVNEGTTFEIILPEAKPPEWFTHVIHIPQNWGLVVLDDDTYIHNIWNQKLTDDFTKNNNINLIHFYTPNELIDYCKNNETNKTIFLLDYELGSQKKNGLQLAEELKIANQTILVTNRYDETTIRESCIKLGIKIIPKSYAMTTTIKIIENVDLIFIDDDESITEIWKERAELSNKKIAVYNDIHVFIRQFNLYENNTLIYIDSSLGGDIKGEFFAKKLYDNGYKNIFIATGYHKEKFKDIHWVKDIVDKHPPF